MASLKRGDGHPLARVMIVGECFGERDEEVGVPFVGQAGDLLSSMLTEAGIMPSECFRTNLVNARPPYNDLSQWIAVRKTAVTQAHVPFRDKMVLPIIKQGFEQLLEEINLVKPDLIIAMGNLAMWALTGRWGILKWRGSQLYSDVVSGMKVIPVLHPTTILKEYSQRAVAVRDLRRAARFRYPGPYQNKPEWNFIIRPSLSTAVTTLRSLIAKCDVEPQWMEFDLETSPEHITCVGVSWSKLDAICIPFCYRGGEHYWTTDAEEGEVIYWLYKLLTHPNCWVRGQNLLYDCQHTFRWWHFVPNVKQDTMLSHHSTFCGMKKSLDFQASIYCDFYEFWKEMHKDLSNKAGA